MIFPTMLLSLLKDDQVSAGILGEEERKQTSKKTSGGFCLGVNILSKVATRGSFSDKQNCSL